MIINEENRISMSMKQHKYTWYCGFIALFVLLFIVSTEFHTQYFTNAEKETDGVTVLEKDNDVLTQEFVNDKNYLEGISLKFGTYGRVNHNTIKVKLSEENGKSYEWKVKASTLVDSKYKTFLLPERLENTYDKKFKIEITSINTDLDNNVALYTYTAQYDYIHYNDMQLGTSLAMKRLYNHVSGSAIKMVVSIVAVFILLLYLYLSTRINWSIEKQFIVLAFITGCIYMVAIPLGKVPDEKNHYCRAYEVSEGYFLSDKNPATEVGGRAMDTNLITSFLEKNEQYNYFKLRDDMAVPLDKTQKTWYDFGNTSLYSPVSYLYQLPGILIGKLISDKTIFIAYMGRLSCFILSLVALFISIKLIPVKKYLIALIAMMPMFIQEMVSLAPDGMTNALCILIVAYALYLAYDDRVDKISSKHIMWMYIFGIVLALAKIVYVPLCFIFFIVPKEKFGGLKKYLGVVISVSVLAFATNIAWLLIASGYLVEFQEGVDTKKQVLYVLTAPWEYIIILFRSILNNLYTWGTQCVGISIGTYDAHINPVIILCYIAVIAYYGIKDKINAVEIKFKDKLIFGGVATLISLLVLTSLYVQWTKVRFATIDGVQGRYFIPIILVVFLAFKRNKDAIDHEKFTRYVYPFLGVVQIFATVALIGSNF
ncbi:membrane protein related to Actinobacillus protein [Lachnospiraceae bacterium KM106-2]|nr:membrane protein related to Actinobacillus protein [Lachnospiraceae bacterium KM106-2]